MNILDAIVVAQVGWQGSEQQQVYLDARETIRQEAARIHDREQRHRNPVDCWGVVAPDGAVLQCYLWEKLARAHMDAGGNPHGLRVVHLVEP